MSIKYYIDMDGVIADWVTQFNEANIMPLEEFNALTREDREILKQEFFTYEFFRTLPVIERGMNILNQLIADGCDVCILSASGRVNRDAVRQAKIDWVVEHVGDIEVLFVDKVEQKPSMIVGGGGHILIDDRINAVEAWRAAGYEAIHFE